MHGKALLWVALLALATVRAETPAFPVSPTFDLNATYDWSHPQGRSSDASARISVGFMASEDDFPAIAAIYLPSALCGGTLISPLHVITAAHCVVGFTAAEIAETTTVYIGLLDRSGAPQCKRPGECETRRVKGVTVHPGYPTNGTVGTSNDLAILTLTVPSTIKPAALAETKPAVASTVRVAGWGLMADTQQTSDALMWTDLQVTTNANCVFNPDFYDPTVSLCTLSTGDWPNGFTASACRGDSGGPLHAPSGGPLLGLVSYGIYTPDASACGKYMRTVFMSVAYYRPWIESVIAGEPVPPPSPPKPSPPPPPSPSPNPKPSPPPKPSPSPKPSPPSPRAPPPAPKSPPVKPKRPPPSPVKRRPPPPRRRRPPPPSPKRRRPPPPSKKKCPPPKKGKN